MEYSIAGHWFLTHSLTVQSPEPVTQLEVAALHCTWMNGVVCVVTCTLHTFEAQHVPLGPRSTSHSDSTTLIWILGTPSNTKAISVVRSHLTLQPVVVNSQELGSGHRDLTWCFHEERVLQTVWQASTNHWNGNSLHQHTRYVVSYPDPHVHLPERGSGNF